MSGKILAVSVALLSGIGFVHASGTLDGTVFRIVSTTDETIVEIPAEATSVVKTGSAKATLSAASTFAGSVSIEAGTLAAAANGYLGTPSEITVGANGTFDVSGLTTTLACPVKVAGTVRHESGADCTTLLRNLQLTASTAKLTGAKRWGWGGASASLDMGGKTLTVDNPDAHTSCSAAQGYANPTSAFVVAAGTITSPGNIDIAKGTLELNGTTFAGGADYTGKTITLKSAKSFMTLRNVSPIPYGVATAPNVAAMISAFNGSGDSTDRKYGHIAGPLTLNYGSTMKFWLMGGHPVTLDGPIHGDGALFKMGTGTLWITGKTERVFGRLNNYSAVNGGQAIIHFKDAGHVAITNSYDKTFYTGDGTIDIGGGDLSVNTPRVNVEGDTVISPGKTIGAAGEGKSWKIRMGPAVGQYGILALYDGAVVSNNVLASKGDSAIYMFGGRLYWKAGASADCFYPNNDGYAYIGMTGGTIETDGYVNLAAPGQAVVDIRGGRFRLLVGQPIKTSRNSSSTHIFVGGTGWYDGYEKSSYLWSNWNTTTYQVKNSHAIYTVDGPSAKFEVNKVIQCVATNGFNAEMIVNVNNGGTFKAANIFKNDQGSGTGLTPAKWNPVKDICPDSKVYLNFNGGILKTAAAGAIFCDVSRQPDKVVVYKGGAIVDTDGKNVTWSAPFEAPTGYTVKSITLPSDTSLDINKANGSVGSMPVTITGVGTGATAIVEYDMTNRKATGIRVTSPGFGYAASGTTAAVVKPTKHDGTHACTVVTEKADTTGGLTKRGAGTLTVSAANTYGGATRLEGGTLAFTSASGIPSGSALEFAAAALKGKALDTPLLTAPAYANNAIRITEADTLDAKTFGKMQTLATFAAPLASVPAFTLVDSDGQTISAGTDWKLALSSDGKSIRFGANRGMTLLIR